MNKFWRIITYGGVPFSILGTVVCLCVFFPRIDNLGFDYMGIIVGILSLIITLLIGWNIYSALLLESRVKNIEDILSTIRAETAYNLHKQDKLRESTEEYAMGAMESMNGFVLLNNKEEKRYMLMYKCYTSAIMHFLRCDRRVFNHITDCLDNMEQILIHWKSAKENRIKYNNFIKNTEGFENAINEIISSPSREFTAEQRKWFITLEERRKQIIN